MNSTLPREAWTMNVGAVEGDPDPYRFNPWRCEGNRGAFPFAPRGGTEPFCFGRIDSCRMCFACSAPGYAPVVDACGMAGGKGPHQSIGGDSSFTTTKLSKMGDKGSIVLKPSANKTRWVAGTSVEVAWGIRYNHGAPLVPRALLCFPCLASPPLSL